MTEDQIKEMVSRFLSWKLPEDFSPDCGIEFDAYKYVKLNPINRKFEPVGTNLFSANQAEAMVRHMLAFEPPPPALDVETIPQKALRGIGEAMQKRNEHTGYDEPALDAVEHTPEPFAAFSNDDRKRLAACWNALAGVSTEDIEAGAVRELVDALQHASDHLNYCEFGVGWDRLSAYGQNLPIRITAALSKFTTLKGDK